MSEVERGLVSVTMTWVLTKPSTDSNDCPHMTHEGVTSLWLSMSTLVGIDVASDTIIIITLEQHERRNDVYQR